jgi:hypothetical protein
MNKLFWKWWLIKISCSYSNSNSGCPAHSHPLYYLRMEILTAVIVEMIKYWAHRMYNISEFHPTFFLETLTCGKNRYLIFKASVQWKYFACMQWCFIKGKMTKLSVCTPWRHKVGAMVQLHSLTLALHCSEWSTLSPSHFTPRDRTSCYPLKRRLCGLHSQSEHFWED